MRRIGLNIISESVINPTFSNFDYLCHLMRCWMQLKHTLSLRECYRKIMALANYLARDRRMNRKKHAAWRVMHDVRHPIDAIVARLDS